MPALSFAIDVCPLGELSDPRNILRLAVAAEEAGWQGISIWDSLGLSMGTGAADPFVALASVAARTRRLRLITSIVALARRRPQLVVQAAASLDLLSDGRLVLGLGAGDDAADFEPFGESQAAADRIGRMEESLAIVEALLEGDIVTHRGRHLLVDGVALGPRPAQRPRPPIWFGGMKPAALRRAARYEGWIAVAMSADGSSMALTPASLGEMVGRIDKAREVVGRGGHPFAIAVLGLSGPGQAATPAEFGAVGATWWLESLSPMRGPIGELEAIVRQGPPR